MKSEFDDYAASYDTALNQGLSLSGEPKDTSLRNGCDGWPDG